jgi:hypothetical protein
MCALVAAIRKLGIVAGGPGLGDVKNPMHILRDSVAARPGTSGSRPGTSSSSDFDSSLGQRRRVAEDPATQVEDDRRPLVGFGYYTEENLNRHLSGTAAVRTASEERQQQQQGGMERGGSFGRRRRVTSDLEKGPQH